MQSLEVSGAVRPICGSLGVKGLICMEGCAEKLKIKVFICYMSIFFLYSESVQFQVTQFSSCCSVISLLSPCHKTLKSVVRR